MGTFAEEIFRRGIYPPCTLVFWTRYSSVTQAVRRVFTIYRVLAVYSLVAAPGRGVWGVFRSDPVLAPYSLSRGSFGLLIGSGLSILFCAIKDRQN